jgi:hypothetical protein
MSTTNVLELKEGVEKKLLPDIKHEVIFSVLVFQTDVNLKREMNIHEKSAAFQTKQ